MLLFGPLEVESIGFVGISFFIIYFPLVYHYAQFLREQVFLNNDLWNYFGQFRVVESIELLRFRNIKLARRTLDVCYLFFDINDLPAYMLGLFGLVQVAI